MRRVALYALLSLARAQPDIISAVDAKWTLSGDTSLVRRGQTQLSGYCVPPAGHEQDVALLAQSQGTPGIEQLTLHFTGGAVVVYGAVLTSGSITEPISYSIDGNKRQQSAPGIATATLDPKSGAACDLAVVEIQPLALGAHVLTFYTGDGRQQIAVYNATIFNAGSLPSSTRTSKPAPSPLGPAKPSHASSVNPSPSSQQFSPAESSQSGVDTTSRSTPTDFTSFGVTSPLSTLLETASETPRILPGTTKTESSTPVGKVGKQGTITEPSRTSNHHALAIALPCTLIPAILLLFIWLRRKHVRNSPQRSVSRPDAGAVRPYLESSRHSRISTLPSKGLWNSEESKTASEDPEEPEEVTLDDDSSSAHEDRTQIIAIQRAVRDAGFSTQALLESLNRVRRREGLHPPQAASSAQSDDQTSIAPPLYDA